MNSLPVIEREMRSASRRVWTFRLRVVFAMVALATCLVVLLAPGSSSARRGEMMLVLLTWVGLLFCLAAGGLLTADCVSSEKREGTLGLLFLTPLRGFDIVLGKMVCHCLQVFYGVWAVYPVFFLPLLTGGVTWAEVARILLALSLAILLSASVGILVSVRGTESRQTLLSTLAVVTLLSSVPMLYGMLGRWSGSPFPAWPARLSPVCAVVSAFDADYRTIDGPTSFWGSMLLVAGLSVLCLVVAVFLIGRFADRTELGWPRKRPSAVNWVPGEVLQANPYEWMVLRQGARSRAMEILTYTTIGFFITMIAVSLGTSRWKEGFLAAIFTAFLAHILIKFGLAVEATRQVNQDRHSGALELLLVSPLPEECYWRGHQRALRRAGRTPLVILLGLNGVLEFCVLFGGGKLQMNGTDQAIFSILFLGGMALAVVDFSAIRWRALLSGLRAPNHTRAALLSFTPVMVLPWVAMGLVFAILNNGPVRTSTVATVFVSWIVSSLVYDLLLVRLCRLQIRRGLRRLAVEGS
jgi:hypothetical protein